MSGWFWRIFPLLRGIFLINSQRKNCGGIPTTEAGELLPILVFHDQSKDDSSKERVAVRLSLYIYFRNVLHDQRWKHEILWQESLKVCLNSCEMFTSGMLVWPKFMSPDVVLFTYFSPVCCSFLSFWRYMYLCTFCSFMSDFEFAETSGGDFGTIWTKEQCWGSQSAKQDGDAGKRLGGENLGEPTLCLLGGQRLDPCPQSEQCARLLLGEDQSLLWQNLQQWNPQNAKAWSCRCSVD